MDLRSVGWEKGRWGAQFRADVKTRLGVVIEGILKTIHR